MDLLDKLEEGDMRTTGKVEEVVERIIKNPELIEQLFLGLQTASSRVKMRCADALEKIAEQNKAIVQPFKDQILEIARNSTQQEVQWHMAQLFSRLKLTDDEAREARAIVLNYYQHSPSNIVQVMSLQALVDIANTPLEKGRALAAVKDALSSGSPSVKTRASKLLQVLKN